MINNISLPDLPGIFDGIDTGKAWECAWAERRTEIIKILSEDLYGYMPCSPETVKTEIIGKADPTAYAGKAAAARYNLSFETDKGAFSFPFEYAVPNKEGKHPFFIYIDFQPRVPNKYAPVEEIIDSGYGIASFCYNDVANDKDDRSGIALMYDTEKKFGNKEWGKIGMWAFAASRVMDWLAAQPEADTGRIAVIGHSRLGKTALWCGALDERFSLAISNDSGCGGAALNRKKIGEQLSGMTTVFPYWFCPDMKKLADIPPEKLRFDSHFLLSLIAPRALLVGSAEEDEWADPKNEFLACAAASPAWERFGKKGFICGVTNPVPDTSYHEGNVGYHMRKGTHYLSRTDWNYYIKYRTEHNV